MITAYIRIQSAGKPARLIRECDTLDEAQAWLAFKKRTNPDHLDAGIFTENQKTQLEAKLNE